MKGTTGSLKIERYTKSQIAAAMEERGIEIPHHCGTRRKLCEVICNWTEQNCPDKCLSLISGAKIGAVDGDEDD